MKKFAKIIVVLGLSFMISGCLYPQSMQNRVNMVKNDPKKFSFNHYYFNREKKIEYFKLLFPIGTPQSFVDKALVKGGKAKKSKIKELKNIFRYQEPRIIFLPEGPGHNVIFDDDKKLDNFNFSLNEYLFSNRTTLEVLRNQNH